MDIRRRVPRLPMHFEFKKSRIPLSVGIPLSVEKQSSTNLPESVAEAIEIKDDIVEQIEQQVKLNQQIVAEWDSKLELMRIQEIEMQRADIVRELNTLIEIWNNANP